VLPSFNVALLNVTATFPPVKATYKLPDCPENCEADFVTDKLHHLEDDPWPKVYIPVVVTSGLNVNVNDKSSAAIVPVILVVPQVVGVKNTV
jgi:hypothetical protein